jgi:ribosomal protein S12 methylthiotransferase
MKEQLRISGKKLRSMIGRNVEVLMEGYSDESDLLLKGRMETQAPDIDGSVLINDAGGRRPVTGEFYRAEITDSLEYDLVRRIVLPG